LTKPSPEWARVFCVQLAFAPVSQTQRDTNALSAVSELSDSILRDKIRFLLKQVADLERLVGRLNLGNASPRDLIALKNSLKTNAADKFVVIGRSIFAFTGFIGKYFRIAGNSFVN
jgi:hypothetical protein